MIDEATAQVGKIITPAELATHMPPIPMDQVFLSASSASTSYWTGNWNDTDSVDD